MNSLDIAATGMLAQQLQVEVTSHNLANMNTTGFKRQRAEFQDLLYQDLLRVGSTSSDTGTIVPSGIQLGIGVGVSAVYRLHMQGNLLQTGNTYDLAIQGRGFFRVTLPDGQTAYSRNGNLGLSPAGQIVTQDGYTVLPGITVPNDALGVTINNSGQVLVTVPGTSTPTNVGQISFANFVNEAGLEARGDNLYLETAASGTPIVGIPGGVGFGTVLQGYVETSNVNPVEEITNLITAQRAYEMLAKVIQTSDQMWATVAQLR